MSRREAEARGRRGERIAAWWLRFQGWRIVAERVKLPMGEVDLIARRGSTLAFIEVKTRQKASDLGLAIDERRLRRVASAASACAARFERPGDTLRIDVILLAPRRWPHHIVNAWQPLR